MRGQQRTGLAKSALKTANGGKPATSIFDAKKTVWLADWKKHKLPYCSIYVVSTDSKWPCKVGISVSPRKRLVQLQTSVWKPLEVAGCYWCNTVNEAKAVEKKMHETLTSDGAWLLGEWFDMRPDKVPPLIEFVASVAGIEIHDTIVEKPVIEDIQEMHWREVNPAKQYARIEEESRKDGYY
jgi:hypothetical protein